LKSVLAPPSLTLLVVPSFIETFRFARLVALSVFGTAVEEKDGEEKVLATSTVATIKASVAIAVLVVVVVVLRGGVWSGR
jgi:hypothetical protein